LRLEYQVVVDPGRVRDADVQPGRGNARFTAAGLRELRHDDRHLATARLNPPFRYQFDVRGPGSPLS
jgi:hypothetical protein